MHELIEKKTLVDMSNKIIVFLREYVFGLSIITMFVGLAVLVMAIIHYFLRNLEPEFIANLEDWNFYLIIIGFIILAIGIWYFYTYYKNKKFILEEIETNRRSEFLKRHADLKNAVRHMPSKYHKMLKDKEEELNIR